MWHEEARRITFCAATRATMGDLVSPEQMGDLAVLYDDIKVTDALVRLYSCSGPSRSGRLAAADVLGPAPSLATQNPAA